MNESGAPKGERKKRDPRESKWGMKNSPKGNREGRREAQKDLGKIWKERRKETWEIGEKIGISFRSPWLGRSLETRMRRKFRDSFKWFTLTSYISRKG